MSTQVPSEVHLRQHYEDLKMQEQKARTQLKADPNEVNPRVLEGIIVSLAWVEYLLAEKGDYAQRYHNLLPPY